MRFLILKGLLLAAIATTLNSCVLIHEPESLEVEGPESSEERSEEARKEVINAQCKRVTTVHEVQDYFFCIGPLGYCWIGESHGLSCTPRPSGS